MTDSLSTRMEPIDALMEANRLACRKLSEAQGTARGPYSLLRGAPSHSGAYLLQALNEMGWQLAPKDEVEQLREEYRRMAWCYLGAGGSCPACQERAEALGLWPNGGQQ